MLRGEPREPILARVVHLAECVLRLFAGEEARRVQPRSPGGKPCNEDPSALSLAPDSLGASGGTAFAGLKIFLSRSTTPILAIRRICRAPKGKEYLAAARKNM
jgi:hypothetical protein